MTDNTSQGSVMVMEEFQIRNFMYGRPDPVVVAKPELNGYLGRTSRMDCDNRSVLSVLLIPIYCFNVVQASTGFYVDNENAQSIPLAVSRHGSARLESKILELLGIEYPRPLVVGVKDDIASRFMADLYRNLEHDVELNPAYKYLASGQLLSADEKEAIELGEADTIVSFLPRGYD
ncbi:unnamed protein product, partial [Onchocerca ochengi]|uniref:TGFb_propeptide domain-containing protein n=1 Tax=Onchocerca ochengi TaxID=42157 RepID=A0A182DXG0_ONCOC